MANTFLHGLALSNYRGIGSELQKIGPFRDVNFFIGPNNSGKSTVLKFIAEHLNTRNSKRSLINNPWERAFENIDIHQGKNVSEIKFGFASISKDHPLRQDESRRTAELTRRVLDTLTENGLLWVFPDPTLKKLIIASDDYEVIKKALSRQEWQSLWSAITRQSGGGLDEHWIPQSLSNIANSARLDFPEVKIVPAIREIGEKDQSFEDFSGKGLIDKLAELQNPPHDQRFLLQKFSGINNFLAKCTGVEDAKIEIPYDRRYVLVHMEGKILPLSSLGTGIHEAVMLAAFCTLSDNAIICVEEPEIHLHPLMQRKLIRYLVGSTSNQYFIATHSASMIDAAPAAIFSVKSSNGETRVKLVEDPDDRHEICQELGYRASDLLQSNAIVWVEGPSDRIYINHWIRHADPDLIEGIHYSVMFYGGRLLSHLSALDPEVHDFISLRKLNRNLAILIDSDKRNAADSINPTKERVVDEFGRSLAWVTAGKEIENYIPVEMIESAISDMNRSSFDGLVGSGQYENVLEFRKKENPSKSWIADKIKVAKKICESAPDLSVLDLQEKVEALVKFIRKANDPK